MLTFCVEIGRHPLFCNAKSARFSAHSVTAAKRWVREQYRKQLGNGMSARLTQMRNERAHLGTREWTGILAIDRAALVTMRWADTTPAERKPRGICPACGGTFALTARGTLKAHRCADGQTETTAAGVEIPASCDGAAQTTTDCQTGEPARV